MNQSYRSAASNRGVHEPIGSNPPANLKITVLGCYAAFGNSVLQDETALSNFERQVSNTGGSKIGALQCAYFTAGS
jgi:hypothetical protein